MDCTPFPTCHAIAIDGPIQADIVGDGRPSTPPADRRSLLSFGGQSSAVQSCHVAARSLCTTRYTYRNGTCGGISQHPGQECEPDEHCQCHVDVVLAGRSAVGEGARNSRIGPLAEPRRILLPEARK